MIFGRWRRDLPQDASSPEKDPSDQSVWMSSVRNNYDLGMKQGARTKFFGHDWNPASLTLPVAPPEALAALSRSQQGHALTRSDFPEAIAIWDPKRFSKTKDLFYAGPFLAVRGALADVLAKFDLGEGGLFPLSVYQADLVTPCPGEFFLLNPGSIKSSIAIEQCGDTKKFCVVKATGVQLWHINDLNPDAEVVLSASALSGPDLWVEESVHKQIFMSDALARAIIAIGLGDVFRLKRCRITTDC